VNNEEVSRTGGQVAAASELEARVGRGAGALAGRVAGALAALLVLADGRLVGARAHAVLRLVDTAHRGIARVSGTGIVVVA